MGLTPRYGYRLVIDDVLLRVQVRPGGWSYHISRLQTGKRIIKNWTVCSPPAVSGYTEPENCKFEAIQAALAELARGDDPHVILAKAEWVTIVWGLRREPAV
jgi:hypothetical protein